MRSVTVRLDDLRTMILNLGYVGENEHRTFNFDCKKMFGEYPSASVSLTVQPPAGDCYLATVERNGDLVSWTVTDSDLIEEGCGEIQLTFMVGEVVAKTCIGRTKVERSLGATGDIPTPIENWIEQAEEVISEAEAATAAAEGAAAHQPIIDDNGYWAVWDADAEEYVATEYKAQGTDGHDGVGIVSIEKTGTSGLVDTYTITFTSGNPVTYTVTNGRDADPTELIDDTAGAGDTDKVWSADKSHELLTEINSKTDKLKSALSNIYADTNILFVRGNFNTSTGVISVDPTRMNRLVTETPIKKGLFKYLVSTDSSLYFYIAYYNSSLVFQKAVGWKSVSYELEDYPFIAVLVKSGSAGTAEFSSTEVSAYLSEIGAVPSIKNIADDVEELDGDVSELTDTVDYRNGLSDSLIYKKTNVINRASTTTGGTYAGTKRWFFNTTIPANSFINVLKYYQDQIKAATELTIELWKLVNGTLTLYKTYSPTNFTEYAVNTITINEYCAVPMMIGFQGAASIGFVQNAGIHICNTSDKSSPTMLLSSLTDFGDYSPSVNIEVVSLKNTGLVLPGNVVTVGSGMDYEQIQEALDGILDDSASKPYTILVMPSGTPYQRFSMIRHFNETYPWNSITPRNVSIIGIDKKHCIIESDSGDYSLPCGEVMTNGIIKNLTFIMTNNSQTEEATKGGYCLHIDCRTLDDVGYNMVIEDCDFEDASGPCLGIGMHKNCTLTIRRCNFKTTLTANYSPHEGYTNLYNYGVIYCHSSTQADATNQRVSFEDCFGVCAEGSRSLWLATAGDYDPLTASFYYRLLRNVFWNETQADPAYLISDTLTAEPMNFGNNIP